MTYLTLDLCSTRSVALFQDSISDLKLVLGESIENVVTLQDCSHQQGETMQLRGE